jgi:hypothetical protein
MAEPRRRANKKIIARLDRRTGIPEKLVINRGAAAYWITRFRG